MPPRHAIPCNRRRVFQGKNDTEYALIETKGSIIVAFRGTELDELTDIATDFKSADTISGPSFLGGDKKVKVSD